MTAFEISRFRRRKRHAHPSPERRDCGAKQTPTHRLSSAARTGVTRFLAAVREEISHEPTTCRSPTTRRLTTCWCNSHSSGRREEAAGCTTEARCFGTHKADGACAGSANICTNNRPACCNNCDTPVSAFSSCDNVPCSTGPGSKSNCCGASSCNGSFLCPTHIGTDFGRGTQFRNSVVTHRSARLLTQSR